MTRPQRSRQGGSPTSGTRAPEGASCPTGSKSMVRLPRRGHQNPNGDGFKVDFTICSKIEHGSSGLLDVPQACHRLGSKLFFGTAWAPKCACLGSKMGSLGSKMCFGGTAWTP
jgi:hypothetical protein